MRNEGTKLFEEMTFDDVLFAQNTLEECETKLNRNKIGMIFAAAVPVIDMFATVIMDKLGMIDSVIGVWIAIAVVAYLIGGGLGKSLKMVWKVTTIGWFIIPIFPIDLGIAATALCMSGAVALFLPIVFVFLTRIQIGRNKKAAEQYLACCKPACGEEVA